MSSIEHFYYSPDILKYDFGPQHPLKPERLRRTIELLGRYGVEPTTPPTCSMDDLLQVHRADFVRAVEEIDNQISSGKVYPGQAFGYGFGKGDNPPFSGMFAASIAYVSATVSASCAVRDGAPMAFAIGGGLHHAMDDRASGFCIFDDPAIACSILREKFDRVAYVDIDVHHGDGPQAIFYDDPTILTCSIHEQGRTLFPGTGFVEETGAELSSLNVPLEAYTTADVWINAFERGVLPVLERFEPGAIVLQLGTDTHALDPLGHIKSDVRAWLEAVKRIKDLKLPTVAVGGGGYNLNTVPRMWTAACLTLADIPFDDELPTDLGQAWNQKRFLDEPNEFGTGVGKSFAEKTLEEIRRTFNLS